MIIFNLKCIDCNFEFEGWFSNSKEYSKQKRMILLIVLLAKVVK